MLSNRLAFAVLGLACIAAAAGGGYLASRQNAVPAPAAAMTTTPAAPTAPVQETEAIVGDTHPAAAPAPVAAPAAAAKSTPIAASKRAEVGRTTAAGGAKTAAPPPRQEPPTLDRTWPSSAQAQPGSASSSPASSGAQASQGNDTAVTTRVEDRTIQESPRALEPPQKTFEELVISTDSVIGLQTETRLSSETARIEDRVDARVTRDVRVGDKVAVPAGARAIGSVTQIERGGKFKERARLGIRFHTLVLADGTRVPMNTETIYREGEAPGTSSAAKIGGGAVGGAILGAILGGAKGAAIGATAGAGGGAAVVAAGDRSAATLPAGTPMTVRILSPVTVTVEQK
jgi:hypothetical protein